MSTFLFTYLLNDINKILLKENYNNNKLTKVKTDSNILLKENHINKDFDTFLINYLHNFFIIY